MTSRMRIHRMIDAVIPNAIRRAGLAYTGKADTRGGRRRGAGSGVAIVDGHFKLGNTGRYKYVPNSPEYQARKASRFPGAPQMVQTGRLRASVVGEGTVTVPRKAPQNAKIRWRNLPDYVAHLRVNKNFNLNPDGADQVAINNVARQSIRQDIDAIRVAIGRSRGGRRVRPGQPPLRSPPSSSPPVSA